jgi:hypothetical protein
MQDTPSMLMWMTLLQAEQATRCFHTPTFMTAGFKSVAHYLVLNHLEGADDAQLTASAAKQQAADVPPAPPTPPRDGAPCRCFTYGTLGLDRCDMLLDTCCFLLASAP